jgi:adenylate cyclase
LLLPAVLQASLGGYVKGSAVIMWSFFAPLSALLFFGPRAVDMLDRVNGLNQQHGWAVGFRIGVNSGPATPTVVGRHRFTYDVWSDTVNSASRMESSGAPGRIQVTEETYRRLSLTHRFECRGQVDIKGKGPMTTYFLIGRQVNGVPR